MGQTRMSSGVGFASALLYSFLTTQLLPREHRLYRFRFKISSFALGLLQWRFRKRFFVRVLDSPSSQPSTPILSGKKHPPILPGKAFTPGCGPGCFSPWKDGKRATTEEGYRVQGEDGREPMPRVPQETTSPFGALLPSRAFNPGLCSEKQQHAKGAPRCAFQLQPPSWRLVSFRPEDAVIPGLAFSMSPSVERLAALKPHDDTIECGRLTVVGDAVAMPSGVWLRLRPVVSDPMIGFEIALSEHEFIFACCCHDCELELYISAMFRALELTV